uniref:Putative secreted protein n=1 Tax=Xenopsylla cheopis TaxID=163159 RepID=A0A6M2DW63_XENCH
MLTAFFSSFLISSGFIWGSENEPYSSSTCSLFTSPLGCTMLPVLQSARIQVVPSAQPTPSPSSARHR